MKYYLLQPKPYDYTTIPGLKLDLDADKLPSLSIEPGVICDDISSITGHIDEINRFPSFRHFLEYCYHCYGPLNSFYWGPRYVVSVCDSKLLADLKKNKDHLLAICPLAVGSLLQGDNRFWTKITIASIELGTEEEYSGDEIVSNR
uniref:Inorganic diphosphatase n=1 Tax=Heterorhabditis bacteriophora TaxID=37862 RepID=A0A1I7WR06_HETBA